MVAVRSAAALEVLAKLGEQVAPLTLAGEQRLPVHADLAGVVHGGLRRGSTVLVAGSTSLALALVAEASSQGSWCAAVQLPSLGLVAAQEAGIDLRRFPYAPAVHDEQWATVVAAFLDGVDIVLTGVPPTGVHGRDARRLAARARERGSVLMPVVAHPSAWPEAPDVRVVAGASAWDGLHPGHGHLCARRLEVVTGGRRGAARERTSSIWIPRAGARSRP